MEIIVQRETYTNDSTIGTLTYGGSKCYTLEDKVRDVNKDGDLNDIGESKVYGETTIPSGRYQVVITFSNRFKKQLPLLINVKGFEGIRIHAGNTKENTHGCILLGNTKGVNMIGESKIATTAFISWLQKVIKTEKVFITIKDK